MHLYKTINIIFKRQKFIKRVNAFDMKILKNDNLINLTLAVIIILSTLFTVISGIYAYKTTNLNSVESNLKFGKVDINIEQYEITEKRIEEKLNKVENKLLPGNTKTFSLKIINKAEPCYVRVKIKEDYYNPDEITTKVQFDEDFLKKDDGFYYLKEPLQLGKSKNFTYKVEVSHNLDNLSKNKKNNIIIFTEAIQSHNFTPDFESSNPWKDTKIEQSKTLDYNPHENTPKVIIKNKDIEEKYIRTPKNFLENLNSIMPGEKLTYVVDIKNPDKENNCFYFNTKINDTLSKAQREVLDKINLSIKDKNNSEIYNGPLLKNDDILLGEYRPNSNDILTFNLFIPENLSNDFSLIGTSFTWNFSKSGQDLNNKVSKNNLKTGNQLNTIPFLIFTISSIILIVSTKLFCKKIFKY